MSDRTYFAGAHITLADVVLYYGLHRVFVSLTRFSKMHLLHLWLFPSSSVLRIAFDNFCSIFFPDRYIRHLQDDTFHISITQVFPPAFCLPFPLAASFMISVHLHPTEHWPVSRTLYMSIPFIVDLLCIYVVITEHVLELEYKFSFLSVIFFAAQVPLLLILSFFVTSYIHLSILIRFSFSSNLVSWPFVVPCVRFTAASPIMKPFTLINEAESRYMFKKVAHCFEAGLKSDSFGR